MKTFRKNLLLVIGLMAMTSLYSVQATTFSKVQARGTGCPLGSTDIVVSPDQSSVSVLFNEMLIELPQFDGDNDNDQDIDGHGSHSRFDSTLVQKVCNILVESQLPPEHKVEAIEVKIDFRGSTFMDAGTTAFFHSQLINHSGPGRGQEKRRDFVARKIWREGPVEDDWTVSSTRRIKINGNCSRRGDTKAQFNLRNLIRASLTLQGKRDNSMVFIGLDSSDLVGKMNIKVHSKSCRNSDRGPVVNPGRGRDPNPGRGRGRVRNCPSNLVYDDIVDRCVSRREFILRRRR